MTSWVAWLIAGSSTVICLLLWFRDVRRIMGERKSTVESAACQLRVCRSRAAGKRDDPAAAAVLHRSEHIYQQAVEHYNHVLRKPWICLPAFLLGFRSIRKQGTGGDAVW